MARGKPKPSWDRTPDPPDYRNSAEDLQYPSERHTQNKNVGRNYGPSTDATKADSARRMAGEIARKKMQKAHGVSFIPRPGGGLSVFDANSNLIGTKDQEDTPISRTKPRKLGGRYLS